MLPNSRTYDALRRDFVWQIPPRFNIGVAISDMWAEREPRRVCLQHFSPDGVHAALTYRDFSTGSSALAAGLSELGVAAGERVAILMPQGFETAIAHAGIYKLGAIALPLALLFGIEALEYRLKDAGAAVVITDRFGFERIAEIRGRLPSLRHVIVSGDGEPQGALSFRRLTDTDASGFAPAETGPDDPAMMIYTSGTTGPPKGALHGHRVLLGHVPGFQFHHGGFPQPGDRMWTPADWAWAGGLLNALLPSLYLGVPVVSSPAQKFDPHMAFRILADMQVRNAFIPPTALRLMKSVADPHALYDFDLRTVGSAGEALGRETFEQASAALGVPVNEFYGQTECNIVLSSGSAYGVVKPGSMGKAAPGHEVGIVDEAGKRLPAGAVGQVAVRRPDPVMFLKYWNDDVATQAKFLGDWLLTGDQGAMDEEGYVTFFGRNDDIITSSGYRIGPSEVEDCLAGHPAVAMAAVIGKPDALRTEIVKAYVVLGDGYEPTDVLASDLGEWVKHRLSMHEYPREIAFVASLPLTTSGKVIRRLLRQQDSEGLSAAV